MADAFDLSLDARSLEAKIDLLGSGLARSLARSMAVAGGKVLRDEAKLLAPVGDGVLKSAIYLAFKEGKSSNGHVVYSVTWNAKRAPHGHLVEFGHWQPFVIRQLPGGEWVTTKVRRKAPKWTPAKPFLRPALENAGLRAQEAMIERGRVRLAELLAGGGLDDDD